jgi:uncharacterized protein YecT (DUF1311 family)
MLEQSALAADDPCQRVQSDHAFTACWREEFKKSESEIARGLRVLAERHRKDEPELHRLIIMAQQAWVAWRDATCQVDTYESKGRPGFSVYWDQCRIRMNKARSVELQRLIDDP